MHSFKRSTKLGLLLLGLVFPLGLALFVSYRGSRPVSTAAPSSLPVDRAEPPEEASAAEARPDLPSAELEVQVSAGQVPLPEASLVLAGPGTARPDFRSVTTGAAGSARR